MTTFAQLSARQGLKNFLRGWLLVLDLKEGLVECATVCVKSMVILGYWVVHELKSSTLQNAHATTENWENFLGEAKAKKSPD